MFQSTISSRVVISGVGVHSGNTCEVVLNPAEENTGVVYIVNGTPIVARYDNVSDTTMSTKISSGESYVQTIEHLSAALYMLGVTNLVVNCSSNEVPILDGSAKIFIDEIQKIGIKKQSTKFNTIRIKKEVEVTDGKKYAKLSQSNGFSLEVNCDFSAKKLETKPEAVEFSDALEKLSAARTFGFLDEVEYVRQHGLAKGASLENTVVFDNGHPIEGSSLRFENEPTLHKMLDAVGDLSLSCGMFEGKYQAFCPGHKLNNMLLRKLFDDPTNYEII